MTKIKVLDKSVSELIAAGEVIERPASIVKELIENCIDAKATSITIEIKSGGIKYIRITDNGCGIDFDDVETAFLRHATSKVENQADLENISTLGFRGEALASISAVSKVEMLTKTKNQDFGTRVLIESNQVLVKEKIGCPDGTTIIIRDLFYNVPARLKFLKKDTSEANAIASIVDKIALSHPEVAIKLIKENKTTLQTSGNASLSETIYSVFGKEMLNGLMEVEYEYNGYQLSGYSSKPMDSRSNRSMQHFFVNGRYVKSRTASVALEEGYKNSIMVGKYPACFINIKTPFNDIDVNVHPAKIEIRFVNERIVFDLVYYAIKTAIAKNSDLSQKPVDNFVKINQFKEHFGSQTSIPQIKIPENREYKIAQPKLEYNQQFKSSEPSIRQFVPPNVIKNVIVEVDENDFIIKQAQTQQNVQEKTIDNLKNETSYDAQEKASDEIKIIGEIFNTYILCEIEQNFVMIDKHAAHERILFEKLKVSQNKLQRQTLLSPIIITLTREEQAAILDNIILIEGLGFEVEDFGNNALIIREIPIDLVDFDIKSIVYKLASNINSSKKEITPNELLELYHSIACRAAVKANDNSTIEQLKVLANQVYYDKNIRYCPHGRPVLITMSKKEIEKRFGRV